MRKMFPLQVEGRHPDRVMDALRHEIRKYLKRERRRELPEGADFWDFDCRFGRSREAAESVHLGSLFALIDEVAREQGKEVYVELLARPAKRSGVKRDPAQVLADELDDTATDD